MRGLLIIAMLAGLAAGACEDPDFRAARKQVEARRAAGQGPARPPSPATAPAALPDMGAAVRAALVASGSDYMGGPRSALEAEALRLIGRGDCTVTDFREWGWTRVQAPGQSGRFFTYCSRPAPLTKYTARL